MDKSPVPTPERRQEIDYLMRGGGSTVTDMLLSGAIYCAKTRIEQEQPGDEPRALA